MVFSDSAHQSRDTDVGGAFRQKLSGNAAKVELHSTLTRSRVNQRMWEGLRVEVGQVMNEPLYLSEMWGGGWGVGTPAD